MKRKKTILLTLIILVGVIFFFRKRIEWAYNDLQEYLRIRNSLVWKEDRRLKWSDFIYDTKKKYADNIYVRVGISQRYHIDDKIDFRSFTLFLPKKSYVVDTTNRNNLRIAQARFDLCEIYRRKLEDKVQELRSKVYQVTTDTLAKYGDLYYDRFEQEWSQFMDLRYDQVEKGLLDLERRINMELKK